MNVLDTKQEFDIGRPHKKPPMTMLKAKQARYPFAAVRLDRDGRVLESCVHDHGRREADAIACARERRWDGFTELLVDEAPVRANDVWLFWTQGPETRFKILGVISGIDVVLARRRGRSD